MSKTKNRIIEDSLHKSILTLAIPIILNNLISTLYNLGDAYWVSKLGDVEVAAVNFVWPVSSLTSAFAMGISVAGASIISQRIGAVQYKEANETAGQLFLFAVGFGIIASILGILGTPYLLHLMGARDELYRASADYLTILFTELTFLFIMNIYLSINQAQGDTLTPTILNASSAILNIVLDPLFIFTFKGGIKGAAIATVLSKVPFAIYCVYQLTRSKNIVQLNLRKLRFIPEKMKEIIVIGIPSSIGSSGVSIGFIILHYYVVGYGDLAMAALGIGNKLNSLAFMPATGIGAALSTITAQNLGANRLDRVKKAYKLSIMLALGMLIVTSSILWIFSRQLVDIFSNSEEVIEMGAFYLRTLAYTTWTIAFFNCALALFNGSGHTVYSMMLDIARLIAFRIPMILIFGKLFPEWGVNVIWYSVGLSNVVGALAGILLTLTNVWKKPVVKDLGAEIPSTL